MKKIIPIFLVGLMFISCATTSSNETSAAPKAPETTTVPAKTEETSKNATATTEALAVTSNSEDDITLSWGKNITELSIDGNAMDKKQRSVTLSAGYHKLSFIVERKQNLFEYGGKSAPILFGFNFLGGIKYNLDVFFTGMKFSVAIRPDLPFIANGTTYTMTKLKMPALGRELEIVEPENVTRPYVMLGNVKSVIQCNAFHFKKVTEEEKIYMLQKACQELEADALLNVFTYTKSSMTNDWVTEAIAIRYTD